MKIDSNFYRENGYLIVEDVINKDVCEHLYHSVVRLTKKYHSEFSSAALDETAWSGDVFNKSFLEFRKDSPKSFGAMYDCVQNTALLQAIVNNKKTMTVAAQILQEELGGLSSSGAMLRMDAPADKRNRLEWHQDSLYYEQNLDGANGCILWFPLHDFTPDYGSIEICIGSHKQGKLMVGETNDDNYEVSRQFHVPEDVIEKYEKSIVDIKCGDAIFFSMDLLHRSGHNVTNKFRFTAGTRFHRMLTDDFLPGRTVYKPNHNIGRLCD